MYTILIILFLIFAACEFATITVYGFYINKKALIGARFVRE